MAEKIQEIEAPGYKRTETDWIINNQRGSLNLDWEKWWSNEKNLLDIKVGNQLTVFEKNLMDNILTIPTTGQSRNSTRINFMRDFNELKKQLSKVINNAKLGTASQKTVIGVAENLRNNEIDSIKQALTTQGFDDNLFPDGNISVAYYDDNSAYAPKDSWTVKNENRASFITHNETGLTLKLNRNGLSFVDNGNFKINNKKIDYESINTPKDVNMRPTGDEFDPFEGYNGPAYDAQTMDADLPQYFNDDIEDAQRADRANADSLDNYPNRAEYFDPLEGYDGPAYDAQTMDRDIPIYENNIAENIDKQTGTPGLGRKSLDVVGKIFGPVDEIITYTLGKGIPKLFAGTALAGVMGGASGLLLQGIAYWSIGNLALAAVKGATTFASEYGGDTTKAMDAILSGEVPEKNFKEAVQESFGEGLQKFTKQMEYDPFYLIVDKGILQPIFGKDQGVIGEAAFKYAGQGINGIKNLFGGNK
jgi:hypothetical protein